MKGRICQPNAEERPFVFLRRMVNADIKGHEIIRAPEGTRRLVEKCGDSLLCVRYRYDEKSGLRLKTAEIIVEARPGSPSFRYRDTDIVALMVPYTQKACALS